MKAYSFTGLLSCYVFVLLLFTLKYPLNSSINNSSFYCGMDGSFDCFILGKYSLQNRRDFLRKQRRTRGEREWRARGGALKNGKIRQKLDNII